jgi:hypothetical protein
LSHDKIATLLETRNTAHSWWPGESAVDALKIDVEGFEDRVLTGFFAEAPQALWPRAVVIEHLSRDEWL